jgi:hypothetical protein
MTPEWVLKVEDLSIGFGRRFLLVTFDPEAATVAGVNTRWWSFFLNLAIGVAAAAAVQAIGALSTFALLTLPAAVALLALGVPLAALTNGFGDGESGPRRPVRRHASAVSKRQAPALPGSEGVL